MFAAFNSLSLSGSGDAIISATLAPSATMGITTDNNGGVWEGDSAADLTLMLRPGQQTNTGKTIASFRFLPTEAFVNGQTRGFGPTTGQLVANVTYADKTTGIAEVITPGSPVAVATSGDVAAGTSSATFASFSSPAINDNGDIAFAATLTPGVGHVTKATAGGHLGGLRRGHA